MRKEAQVIALHPDNLAELSVKRDSACGDCASCGGCAQGRVSLKVTNTLNAKIGDRVLIETQSGTVLSIAALIYLLPLLLFFVGYAIGSVLNAVPVLIGGAGFLAALAAAVILNHKLPATIGYDMVGFVEDAS